MLTWFGPINSGAAVGGAGVATANNSSHRVAGKVHAIEVKYNDSPPVTTDVTIATVGASAHVPAIALLTLSNANTDTIKYPRVQVQDTAGVGLTLDGTRISSDKIEIDDAIKVTIDQANAGDNVDVWVCLEN